LLLLLLLVDVVEDPLSLLDVDVAAALELLVELSVDDLLEVSDVLDVPGPLADDVDERESLMYQPLPLKTMPTG
jgi:hypothetical protein